MSTNPYYERPPIIEQVRAESRGEQYRPAKRNTRPVPARPTPEDSHRLFTVATGNRWMELARREPEAKMLFGELWHQGELCMLFADTNIGKSILAVQLGESIARGQGIAPFACQAPPARVCYIDFELTKSQFGLRYSKGEEDHEFSDSFFRAQYNFIPDPPPNVDENELLIAAIEYKVERTKATVLIIDNITCLRGGTENSAVALSLMKNLKALKTDHNLSILVLAHTPKRRNATQPISADDLHGSKLLINFADSAFALGKSTAGADLCYLKQIKQRNTRQRYGDDNVCLCHIQKPGTFLHFKFEGHSAERLHLLSRTAADRQQLAGKIAALAAKGFSQRDISNQLNIGLATVNRLLPRDGECCVPQVRDADEKGFENLKMRGFEDEQECADEESVDVRMRGYEEEVSTDNEGFKEMQMPENTEAESSRINSVRSEFKAQTTPTEELTSYAPLPQPAMDDIQLITPGAKLKPHWGMKTSLIDMLLSPELLEYIKRTVTLENSIPEMRDDKSGVST